MVIEPRHTLMEVLKPWWIGVISLLVSLIATPVMRWIGYRMKIVDRPDDLLKPHGRPVAYLGGVAICIGLLAGLAGYVFSQPRLAGDWAKILQLIDNGRYLSVMRAPLWNVLGIAAAAVVIMLVGLVDDLRNISPRKKLLGQVFAAMILLGGGVGDRMAMIIFGAFGYEVHTVPAAVVLFAASAVMCVALVIATCNATNLIDGLDGLCGGVTGIMALGFLALSVFLAAWESTGNAPTDNLRVCLCLAMAGAVLGFLPYNIPPASIFMGDAGSMLLGFFVASMMALFCEEGNIRWMAAACMVFALPILDTSLAVVRRLLSGKGIFYGDRSHLYDQLIDRGMSVKRVVMLFYALAALAATVGVCMAIFLRFRVALPIYLAILAAVWIVFFALRMVLPPSKDADRTPVNRG